MVWLLQRYGFGFERLSRLAERLLALIGQTSFLVLTSIPYTRPGKPYLLENLRNVRSLSVEELDEVGDHLDGLNSMIVELLNVSLFVNKVFSEVASDDRVSLWLQPLKDLVGFFSHGVALPKHLELDAISLCRPLFNFELSIRLRWPELVAWERQNLKTALRVGTMHVNKLPIIPVRVLTFAGHVNHNRSFCTFHQALH